MHLFKLGTPVALQMGVEAASFSLAVIMVGWLGSIALAAHQIIAVISTLGFMFFYGLSSAVTIRMSRYYEVGDVPKMRATVTTGLTLQLLMAISFVILLLLTRHIIGRIFTRDEELVSIVATLCIPVMVYQFGDVLQILFANALRDYEMSPLRQSVRSSVTYLSPWVSCISSPFLSDSDFSAYGWLSPSV